MRCGEQLRSYSKCIDYAYIICGSLTKPPQTKSPMDFCPRNFVMKRPWDKTVLGTKQSLGQSSPWTKHPRQICDKTSPFSGTDYPSLKMKLCTIFSDKTSLAHTKLIRLQLPAASLAARPRRPGTASSGTAKNDASFALTVSASAIRLHKKFGASLVHFFKQNLGRI
jgi:hypothetical protein